ncbi:tRNA pseudouridine synthase B [Platysternon megacephalum]|uniref:tRNA pseudouridine synthase B n=1 Tax=Platysternon megacephalum TaxID=55544 RepID=A0A4D9DHB9_9SAUR|nr:tRNA pseudouridine synthase B [Platysternon megacephalum]
MIDVEDVVPQQVHGLGGDDAGVYYSIDEALSAAEFGRFQYSVLAYAGLGYLMDAMEVMLLSFIGPSVKSLWGLSAAEEGLITTVVFAGMLIGAYSWGVFSDNFGRRKTMLSIAIQDEALTTLLLSGARMCFLGTFTITVIYCPEIYPTSVRTTGSGIANAVGRIAGMICPIVAVQFISGCEIIAAILLFEVIAVVSGLCVLLFRTETKGQQLSDAVVAS